MATKIPAWARFPRHHLVVTMAANGFKTSKNELIKSLPRLFARLNRLLKVDTATVSGANVTVAIDDKTDTFPLAELGQFVLDPNDYIATRASIALTPATDSLAIAETVQGVVTVTYSDATTDTVTTGVVWTTSNAAIATVSGSGLITGVAAGVATITASYKTFSDTSAITVTA